MTHSRVTGNIGDLLKYVDKYCDCDYKSYPDYNCLDGASDIHAV